MKSVPEQANGSTQRPRLSNATIGRLPEHVAIPDYDRHKIAAGIVHIGVGSFHRAHEALFVDRCLHLPGHDKWGIIGVGLGEGEQKVEKARAIKSQDGLYTLIEYASDGGIKTRVVGSILDYFYAPSQTEGVLDRLAHRNTRIVSLTITEGGYNIDEVTGTFDLSNSAVLHDLAVPHRPRSAFGFIVQGLARRRAAGLGGFTVLSCDNLRSNGAIARKAILGFAEAHDAELAEWIDQFVSFPNSMVDRIAPTVGSAEKLRANRLTGIDDATPAIAESFLQWVLEDKFVAGRPGFDQVGVEIRDDVESFEAIKGRLLNASHMMLSYPALMCGYRLVDEALREPVIVRYLDAFMEDDVIPLIKGPVGVSLQAYKRQVLERFSNPAIGDQLLRIAHDGIAKLPTFLSKTLTQLLSRGGNFERVALCLASFERYLTGQDYSSASLTVEEPHLTDLDRSLIGSTDPIAVLRLAPFRALGLFSNEAFTKVFQIAKRRLADEGPTAALAFAANARGAK
jgi:mannitol-1-phosphate/altronate dehydrogenase